MISHRCVVNVAVHHDSYLRRQDRLVASLDVVGWDEGRATWRGTLPPGSPPHDQVHYGFKAYALQEAIAMGFRTILWVDSGPCFIRHPGPLFEAIEQEGHWIFYGTEFLDRWSSDLVLKRFNLTRDEAEKILFCGGSAYGFDVTNPRTREVLVEFFACVRDGSWAGPFINDGPHAADARAGLGPRSTGKVSDDPRCWGHRQDETILSALAHRYQLRLVPGGDWGGPWIAADTPENHAREEIVLVTGRW